MMSLISVIANGGSNMDKQTNWTIKYDAYDELIERFEKFKITNYFPSEEDLELMETKLSYEMVLFAVFLENILQPKTTEETYRVKALREFIGKHVTFVD